jgi:galactokinase/mevalonate kinase-like predicted kinase
MELGGATMDVTIKKIKYTTLNKTYTEKVRDWRGNNCFATQYPNPDGKRIFLTFYMVDKGYTLSKVFNKEGEFMYYYCDIMKMKQVGKWRYVMVDLLLDLIVYADGSYDVLDIDEFANAIDKGELKRNRQVYALRILHEMIQLQRKRRLIPPFIHKAEMYDTTIDGY